MCLPLAAFAEEPTQAPTPKAKDAAISPGNKTVPEQSDNNSASAASAQPKRNEDQKPAVRSGTQPAASRESPPPASQQLPEVVVTAVATRGEKKPMDVPAAVETFTREQMEKHNAVNLVDTFKESPGTFIQKTGQGQGSPFIRGFTGYRNVIMIDGVRFNNATFRGGPNQYWATIDPLFAERVEVLRGPGSTLYGSDAVGGVVNVITKSTDTWGQGVSWGGEVYSHVGVAEQARVGHAELQGSYKDKLGWIVGGSFTDTDDFRGGRNTGTVENSDYQDGAFNSKIQFRPISDHELTLYYDYFNEGGAPQTQETVYSRPFHGTTVGTDFRNDLDQDRQLSYARYAMKDLNSFVEEAAFTISWQKVKQEQHRTRLNNKDLQTVNAGFEDNILGGQIQAVSNTPLGRLTYGIETYHEAIASKAATNDLTKGTVTQAVQGPLGDDATYETTGVFIQEEKDLFDGMLALTAGGRFEYVDLNIGRMVDPNNTNAAIGMDEDYRSLVGSFKALVRPDKGYGGHWSLWTGISQSFRAPSVYDLSAGETSNSFTYRLPGPQNTNPEKYLTPEIGVKARYPQVSLELDFYQTFIDGQLSSAPTGQFASDGRPIVAPTLGSGRGWVKGIETAVSWDFVDNFNLWCNLSWTEGETDQFGTDRKLYRKPADRIIPVMSHFGVKYEPKKEHWWVELHADAFTDADRLSISNRADTKRIPPGGTPGFFVPGIRGGVKLVKDRLSIVGAVDNLTNTDYRIHGSGQNMPGTNFSLSVQWKW